MTFAGTLRGLTSLWCVFGVCAFVTGCANLPQAGPDRDAFSAASVGQSIRLVTLAPEHVLAQRIARVRQGFADAFAVPAADPSGLGIGDSLEVTIWEAPPAVLFGGSDLTARNTGATGGARGVTLPIQVIGRDGAINVPFVGRVQALGRQPDEIGAEITRGLRGKAHQPQVLVRKLDERSALATVVGEVGASIRLPLTDRRERVLDALASANGSKHPAHKTTIQLTRAGVSASMPLDRLIREPQHNIILQAGDVVTAIFQSASFTALGAVTQNGEIPFEAQGISLAQAVARVGGLQDARADAQGVFVFRMAAATTAVGSSNEAIPTVYQVDLKQPAGLLLAQQFMIEDKDLIYVSNAPAADWQKFANLIYTIALPAISTINSLR